MSIQAWNNDVGRHEHFTQRQNAVFEEAWVNGGKDYIFNPVRTDSDRVLTDLAIKNPIVHSDKKTPTTWGRQIGTVLEDSPLRFIDKGYWNEKDHWQTTYTRYISRQEGQFAFLPIMKNSDNCGSEAVTEALLSLKGKDAASLGADIGQIRQLGEMLAADAIKAMEVFKALKRGNLRRAASVLGLGGSHNNAAGTKAVANWWLEYAYGWKPLAGSIHDVHKQLTGETRKDMFVLGHGYSSNFGSYEPKRTGWNWIESWTTDCKTVIYAKLEKPGLYAASQLGLVNPASIIWELVPWSFAVDWFVPVGNVLDAMTAGVGLSFQKGWSTFKSTAWKTMSYNMADRGPDSELISPGSYRERMFEFHRTAYDGFPRPTLYADTTPFSTPRILNAAALFRQQVRG